MRKNKSLKAIIIAAFILAGIICAYCVKRTISNHILDGPGMVNDVSIVSLDYNESGDEYGRSSDFSLTKDGLLKSYYDGGTVEGSVKKVCRPGEDFDTALEQIIMEYDVRSWVDLPASEFMILDGSTATMTIQFADGLIVKLGDDYEMPDDGWKAVAEITDLCESCIEECRNTAEVGKEIIPADDSGLELLVDYCEKTAGTADGDGYSEIVLYENEDAGTYQLHTYRKYEGMDEEEHHAYQVSEETADDAFEMIGYLNLVQYKDKKGTGADGAEYVVKFKQDDELIRISTDNMGADGQQVLSQVGEVLYDVIPAENNQTEDSQEYVND